MLQHRVHISGQTSALQALAGPNDESHFIEEDGIVTVLTCERCLREIGETMRAAGLPEKEASLGCDLAQLLLKRSAKSRLEGASIAALKAHADACTKCDITEVVNQLQPNPI